MISEKQFKNRFIEKLNTINAGWIDGDKEMRQGKKADIVSNLLKIAIEIKDDTHYKLECPQLGIMVSGGEDLNKMNERFTNQIKDANKKFKEYPNYQTVFLLRTEFPIIDVIRYSIDGLYQISFVSGMVRRTTKYSEYIRKEIGCYIVLNNDAFYFPNQYANQNRILEKIEIERILGIGLKDVSQI